MDFVHPQYGSESLVRDPCFGGYDLGGDSCTPLWERGYAAVGDSCWANELRAVLFQEMGMSFNEGPFGI